MPRPRKQIDEKKVEQSPRSAVTRKKSPRSSAELLERRYAGALKRGRARRNQNLHKLQYEAAKRGNVTMQICLGKQWFAQKDPHEADDKPDLFGELLGGNRKRYEFLTRGRP